MVALVAADTKTLPVVYVKKGFILPQNSILDRFLNLFRTPRFCYTFTTDSEYFHVPENKVPNKDILNPGKTVVIKREDVWYRERK